MKRDLAEPLPEPVVPAGLTIRTFVPGQDEAAWLAVNAAAFASHPEQGAMTAADLAARMAEPWFDPAGFFVAERDGAMVGFHWTKQHRTGWARSTCSGSPRARAPPGHRPGTADHRAGLPAPGGATRRCELYVEAASGPAVALYAGYGFTTARVM